MQSTPLFYWSHLETNLTLFLMLPLFSSLIQCIHLFYNTFFIICQVSLYLCFVLFQRCHLIFNGIFSFKKSLLLAQLQQNILIKNKEWNKREFQFESLKILSKLPKKKLILILLLVMLHYFKDFLGSKQTHHFLIFFPTKFFLFFIFYALSYPTISLSLQNNFLLKFTSLQQ